MTDLLHSRIASGQAPNTIEFHWYAAEEGGLLGSQAVFTNYKNSGKVVKAMLQQDMTGYVKPGTREAVGVITDYVDAGLTAFIKRVVTTVSFSLFHWWELANLYLVLHNSLCRDKVWVCLL
jgi:leucyl aminopeptidase